MSSTLGNFGRTLLLARLLAPDLALGFTECHFALTPLPIPLGGTGLTSGEPTGAGYVRVPYPLGTDYWQLSGYATFYNRYPIQWPAATGEWGGLSGWALMTTQTAGDVVMTGTLSMNLEVTAGDVVTISQGAVMVNIRD